MYGGLPLLVHMFLHTGQLTFVTLLLVAPALRLASQAHARLLCSESYRGHCGHLYCAGHPDGWNTTLRGCIIQQPAAGTQDLDLKEADSQKSGKLPVKNAGQGHKRRRRPAQQGLKAPWR